MEGSRVGQGDIGAPSSLIRVVLGEDEVELPEALIEDVRRRFEASNWVRCKKILTSRESPSGQC
jgi:hypothetical protein